MSDSESHAPCDNSAPPSSGSHAEPKPNTDRRSTPTQPEHSALERLVDVYHGRLPCGYLEKLKAEELEAEELEAKELAAVKSQPETLEELILENVNRIFCTEQEQIAQDIIARYTEEQDEKVLKDIERILETRCKENDDQQRGGLDLQYINDRRSTPTQPEHSVLDRLDDLFHGRLPPRYLEELAAAKSQSEDLEKSIDENVKRIFGSRNRQWKALKIIYYYTIAHSRKALKEVERILEILRKENDDQQRGGLDLQDIKDEGMSQEQRDIQEPEMLQKQGPVM
ncbi:hypothetical protein EDC01DRAFT_673640 [Geopyxis carbonaria]|nr:hypothetical protein EDC01DRAFT_673640 [Geopyxis carbonaria]